MGHLTDYCPDCDGLVTWAKRHDVRTCYELVGLATVLVWNAATDWPEPVDLPTYRVHQCPGPQQEAPHA